MILHYTHHSQITPTPFDPNPTTVHKHTVNPPPPVCVFGASASSKRWYRQNGKRRKRAVREKNGHRTWGIASGRIWDGPSAERQEARERETSRCYCSESELHRKREHWAIRAFFYLFETGRCIWGKITKKMKLVGVFCFKNVRINYVFTLKFFRLSHVFMVSKIFNFKKPPTRLTFLHLGHLQQQV